MILSLAEAKTYLDISTTDYDSAITRLVPVVQEQITAITHNDFIGRYIVSINSFDTNKVVIIPNAYGNILDAGDDVYISGSIKNEGHWEIDSVSGNELTITGIKSEPTWVSVDYRFTGISPVNLGYVDWPEHLKYIASQMVQWHMDTGASEGISASPTGEVQSATRADISVTYKTSSGSNATSGIYNYPQHVIKDLQQYTLVRFR